MVILRAVRSAERATWCHSSSRTLSPATTTSGVKALVKATAPLSWMLSAIPEEPISWPPSEDLIHAAHVKASSSSAPEPRTVMVCMPVKRAALPVTPAMSGGSESA